MVMLKCDVLTAPMWCGHQFMREKASPVSGKRTAQYGVRWLKESERHSRSMPIARAGCSVLASPLSDPLGHCAEKPNFI